ncbi:hypothetical protein CcCBS67573_g06273 [Chytriomyces confervae]|uniref:t-SNARE coiled-coil homology domain-containing protein n=1 Tax=Chytriomyces confervae TaxID=246404 RepID=A0A507F6H2_9FUNG|nr:hypothetical protein CcCBS67573_g06273 [Chytriomyces confervae]
MSSNNRNRYNNGGAGSSSSNNNSNNMMDDQAASLLESQNDESVNALHAKIRAIKGKNLGQLRISPTRHPPSKSLIPIFRTNAILSFYTTDHAKLYATLKADGLTRSLFAQISVDLHDNVNNQNRFLEDMSHSFNQVGDGLKTSAKRMQTMLKTPHGQQTCTMAVLVVVLLLSVWALWAKWSK